MVRDAWAAGLAQLLVLPAQLASVRSPAVRADAQRRAPLVAARSVSAEQRAERQSEPPGVQLPERESQASAQRLEASPRLARRMQARSWPVPAPLAREPELARVPAVVAQS